MRELEAGVAGAGVFGAIHARKYAELEGVRLTRVFDLDASRANDLAARFDAQAFSDPIAFFEGLDVVTIATPGSTHAALGLHALKVGLHVYMEKPLAVREADAHAIAAAAKAGGRIVAVGHQERVVLEAMGLLKALEPTIALASVRRGLPAARNRDISCVLDLMIHDLDLALSLARSPAAAISAHGGFDSVEAKVTFEGGLVAHFAASREATHRERTMHVDFASGAVDVDFLAPRFTNASAVSLDADFSSRSEARDPLGASVGAFVQAVRGAGLPLADADAGARAVTLALAIEAAAGM